MEKESKDPALGTISENKIKVPLEPEEKLIKATEKPRKGNPYKLAIWILSILLVLAIGAIIFLAFCPASPLKQCAAPDDNQPGTLECPKCEASEAEDVAVRQTLQQLETALAQYISNEYPNAVTNLLITKLYDTGFPAYAPEGTNGTLIPLNRAYSLSYAPSNEDYQKLYDNLMNGSTQQVLAKVLTYNNFTEYEGTLPGGNSYLNSQGVLCSMGMSGWPFTVSCGNTAWVSAESVALAGELATAYQEKTGNDLYYVYINGANVTDSEYEPYQRMEVSLMGAMGLFYRTSPESNWQFFMATQAPLGCAAFDTEDLKRAFMGEPCYAESTVGSGEQDTVKP